MRKRILFILCVISLMCTPVHAGWIEDIYHFFGQKTPAEKFTEKYFTIPEIETVTGNDVKTGNENLDKMYEDQKKSLNKMFKGVSEGLGVSASPEVGDNGVEIGKFSEDLIKSEAKKAEQDLASDLIPGANILDDISKTNKAVSKINNAAEYLVGNIEKTKETETVEETEETKETKETEVVKEIETSSDDDSVYSNEEALEQTKSSKNNISLYSSSLSSSDLKQIKEMFGGIDSSLIVSICKPFMPRDKYPLFNKHVLDYMEKGWDDVEKHINSLSESEQEALAQEVDRATKEIQNMDTSDIFANSGVIGNLINNLGSDDMMKLGEDLMKGNGGLGNIGDITKDLANLFK